MIEGGSEKGEHRTAAGGASLGGWDLGSKSASVGLPPGVDPLEMAAGPIYGRLERTVVEREVLRDGTVRTREQAGMTAVEMKPGQGVKSSDGVCYVVGPAGELRRAEPKRAPRPSTSASAGLVVTIPWSARQARKVAKKSRRAMRLAWSGL